MAAVVLVPGLFGFGALTKAGGASPDVLAFLQTVSLINLGLLIFNVLPIYPVDGGQVHGQVHSCQSESRSAFCTPRVVSSVVEHHLDTVGVAGSNPAPRTISNSLRSFLVFSSSACSRRSLNTSLTKFRHVHTDAASQRQSLLVLGPRLKGPAIKWGALVGWLGGVHTPPR